MKKLVTLFSLLLTATMMNAQSYIGFLTDNYSGVNSVISNPANIVDSRFKTDINIAGVSSFIDNNYQSVKIGDLFKGDFNGSTSIEDNNAINVNADVLGPSFMMNIAPKHSIAISTRVRSIGNLYDVNGKTIEQLSDGFNGAAFSLNEGNMYSSVNAWGEIGASYATVLFNEKEHFVKGGLTLKYLKGLGNAYATGNNVNINYDGGATVSTTGEVVYGYSENFKNISDGIDDVKIVEGASGFGGDIGFIYEWRPNYSDYTYKDSKGNTFNYKDVNKYKLKIGLSVTDIGSVNYKNNQQELYNATRAGIPITEFSQADDVQAALENIYGGATVSDGENASLPTALHFNADWHLKNKFYINLNTDFAISGSDVNTNQISNTYMLTPRYESKWFSFYLPLGMYEQSGFQAGAGFRAGPLYVGSGSIITSLANDEAKGVDLYAGLKIPVFQSRPKDSDGDGILDKADNCPKTSGPEENFGCPWGDSDGDGVLDNDDKCPKKAGDKQNSGCPWGDKDGDGVLDNVDKCPELKGDAKFNGCPDTDDDGIADPDDKCPNEAGSVEDKGCPAKDSDGDGVADKDDQCPKLAGPKENKGCPVISKEATAKLNEFARAIYFNSSRSSFRPGVTGKLDLIVDIMNKYNNAKFNIEGHTDSSGANATNLRLSEKRAKAVLDYLVGKGIDPSRLTSVGYGEDYPIASNTTRAGRAENRRVEIKLVK